MRASKLLAIGAALLALAAPGARADDFTWPEQGIRLKLPEGYELRTKGLKFIWTDAKCELKSADGVVSGSLLFLTGVGTPAQQADEREAFWKARREMKDVARLGDDTPKREGAWLRRDFAMTHGPDKRRYAHLFGTRGSRSVELVVWTLESAWEAHAKEVQAIVDSLEFRRVWLCASCGAETTAEATACAGCKASLVAPDPDLEKILRRFKIQLVVDTAKLYPFKIGGERVVGKPATIDDVRPYCAMLAHELARYPDDVLEKLALERIVLCKDLFGGSMRRGALVDHESDAIHCSVTEGAKQDGFQKTALHHELYHIMDRRDDGTVEKDAAWEALNPGFRYASRNKDAPFDGFASLYGMTKLSEDKAEVYANLMARPDALAERAAKDALLKRKIDLLKAQLKAWSAAVDEKFWGP